MKLFINVTQQDIEEGDSSCAGCPVALAATRALHEAGFSSDWRQRWHAEFEPYRMFSEPTGFTIWQYHDGGDQQLFQIDIGNVPYKAYEFGSMFDGWAQEDEGESQYECPAPFSFDLEVPGLTLPQPQKGGS